MWFPPVEWAGGRIRILDQTRLPEEILYLGIDRVEDLAEAVRRLRVRGAPAIGIAAAFGVALAAHADKGEASGFVSRIRAAVSMLAGTRPTAVNLFWALRRMEKVLDGCEREPPDTVRARLLAEALAIQDEDRAVCRKIGGYGAGLLPDPATVLTHCNAGGLATSGFGTALGVVYAAAESGKTVRVIAGETRPLMQGARLTAWELKQAGIGVTVICDSAAGAVLMNQKVDCVLVGADRIAADGDAANKVGTYSLSVLAKAHHVPFYVAAPASTFDLSIRSGADIPIEERGREEVALFRGKTLVPEGVPVFNPAFDVTPGSNITAFITEFGILCPPFDQSFAVLPRMDLP